MEIKAGTLVMLSQDAVYYNGKTIPDWVKRDKWIVQSISKDRVVLGKNESGSHEIKSPVNLRHVLVAGQTPAEVHKPGEVLKAKEVHKTPDEHKTDTFVKQGGMNISDKGVELVAKYEGCRLQAYKCPAGVWTIGYGHTAGVRPGQTLTSQKAAKELLKEDLKKYAESVNYCVKKGLISFPLNQNQFDALTSFCYNCGAGNLHKLVNGRSAPEVAEKFMAYTKGGGRVLPGLVRRREEERALFLS